MQTPRSIHKVPLTRLGPVLVVAALGALIGGTALADDAMRCGNNLVQAGDPSAKVRGLCGEPVDRQTHTILQPLYGFRGRPVYFDRGVVAVPVELWTYNFGPHRLMQRVRFVDAVVVEIETLGYGYQQGED